MLRNSIPRYLSSSTALDDVARRDRDVLRAGAAVVLEVLVDLRLALALGRLVERELHAAVAVGDDLRHQRGVLGRDVVVGEVEHLPHPEDVLVVLDPLVHVAELDVADDVVDREQAGVAARRCRAARSRAGTRPCIRCGRRTCAACRRRWRSWRRRTVPWSSVRSCGSVDAARAALGGLAVGVVDVRHAERDHLHAVAVARRRGRRSRGRGRARRSARSGCGPARARARRGRARRSPGRRRRPP